VAEGSAGVVSGSARVDGTPVEDPSKVFGPVLPGSTISTDLVVRGSRHTKRGSGRVCLESTAGTVEIPYEFVARPAVGRFLALTGIFILGGVLAGVFLRLVLAAVSPTVTTQGLLPLTADHSSFTDGAVLTLALLVPLSLLLRKHYRRYPSDSFWLIPLALGVYATTFYPIARSLGWLLLSVTGAFDAFGSAFGPRADASLLGWGLVGVIAGFTYSALFASRRLLERPWIGHAVAVVVLLGLVVARCAMG
jgi:hypothetical protein